MDIEMEEGSGSEGEESQASTASSSAADANQKSESSDEEQDVENGVGEEDEEENGVRDPEASEEEVAAEDSLSNGVNDYSLKGTIEGVYPGDVHFTGDRKPVFEDEDRTGSGSEGNPVAEDDEMNGPVAESVAEPLSNIVEGDNGSNAAVEGTAKQEPMDETTTESLVRDAEGQESSEGGLKRKLETDSEEALETKKEKKEYIPSATPHLDDEIVALLPDLRKYWIPVEEDASDFSGWTHLLQYVDHADLIPAAREAYDGFLARYPYCYGYWKKYADYEKRKGCAKECEQVFDRGLKAIPLSVDLWVHYLNYIKTVYESDPELIRGKYKDAIEACGMEFRSDKLWEHYIQWEMESRNWQNVMAIYDQLIRLPTQSHKTHFEKLEAFVNERLPSEILDAEELYNLTLEEVSAEEAEQLEKGAESGNTDAWQEKVLELTPKLREKIIESRNKAYAANVAEVAARFQFEDAIKRPYFHVKPVERNQLKMWKEYLDFEIERGDLKRIIVLFERCLIACAMYEDYWEKYLQFLQSQVPLDVARIRDVYFRICNIHHQKKAKYHLQRAAFEEKEGNIDAACASYEKLQASFPPTLPVYYRHINCERRRGNFKKCEELFEAYIKASDNKAMSVHMTVKFARFVNVCLNSYDKAVELLKAAVEMDDVSLPSTRAKVLMALVDLGLHAVPVDRELVVSTFDKAIATFTTEQKLTFAQRKLEFLEDYGDSIESILAAEEEVQNISKTLTEKPATETANPPEVAKDPGTAVPFSQPPSGGYDQYSGSQGGYGYNQYGQGQGQYSGNWSSGPAHPPSGPSGYGPSYNSAPPSGGWNSSSYYG